MQCSAATAVTDMFVEEAGLWRLIIHVLLCPPAEGYQCGACWPILHTQLLVLHTRWGQGHCVAIQAGRCIEATISLCSKALKNTQMQSPSEHTSLWPHNA
jgi:hypothetical protein